MKEILRDALDEVKQFLRGKTVDALFPPIVYIIANNFFELKITVILALSAAALLGIFRLFKKEGILYALGGIGGVAIASGFALLADNAVNYFLPKVINSAFLFSLSSASVLIGKPLAAILSHISRGWSIKWYMRKDVKPAYREVTIVWSILLFIRMSLQWTLFKRGNLAELGWASIFLGFPATLSVLILSVVYGVWRLRKLGGPGIDEFEDGKEAPWLGQKKGF